MSEKSVENLNILNFLLSRSELATFNGLPQNGKYISKNFNFIWARNPRLVQILVLRDSLIYKKDVGAIKESNFKFERPACFLEYEIQVETTFETIKSDLDQIKASINGVRQSILEQTKLNLTRLREKAIKEKLGLFECWKKKPSSATAHELKSRLEFLHQLMEEEFFKRCDKWIIPGDVVYPECALSEVYKEILTYDPMGLANVFSEWLQEFEKTNRYP